MDFGRTSQRPRRDTEGVLASFERTKPFLASAIRDAEIPAGATIDVDATLVLDKAVAGISPVNLKAVVLPGMARCQFRRFCPCHLR